MAKEWPAGYITICTLMKRAKLTVQFNILTGRRLLLRWQINRKIQHRSTMPRQGLSLEQSILFLLPKIAQGPHEKSRLPIYELYSPGIRTRLFCYKSIIFLQERLARGRY